MDAVQSELNDAVALAQQFLRGRGIDPSNAEVQRLLACPDLSAAASSSTQQPTVQPDLFNPGFDESSRAARSKDTPNELSLSMQVAAAVRLRQYEPARARRWTADDIAGNKNINRCTREKRCAAFIDHPFGAVVEFPETGAVLGEAVAHRFAIDPDSKYRPHHSFQYSLGGESHGGHKNVDCYLIDAGNKIKCKSLDYSCQCVRACTFVGSDALDATPSSHSYTSPTRQSAIRSQAHSARTANVSLAEVEVFRKTLALFCAVKKHGCALRKVPDFADEPTEDLDEAAEPLPDSRSQLRQICGGQILLKQSDAGQSYLECEHRRKGSCDHLILRNLQDFDLEYLRALWYDDKTKIRMHEENAAQLGIGPLVACHHTRSCRSQAKHCPNWHRGADGLLRPGQMSRESKCGARFRIFEPADLHAHPYIVVVCTSPHSHQPPERSMTPPPLRDALKTVLLNMRWQLADATPRRVVRDSGFMSSLRCLLDWGHAVEDPVLSDLHPSLGNLDHLAHLIDEVRKPMYPAGTDFKGACDLHKKHLELPLEQRYVRFAEEVKFPDSGRTDRMVLCMFPSQSLRLLQSKRVEVDIQFSRVKSWYEFQMTTWDSTTSQSTTLCRAFLTSESASSHHELYRQIFKIVLADTGHRLQFRYMHGSGLEIFTADEHRGHALGLGQFLAEIAQDLTDLDQFVPHTRLCDLSPYEHLARIFRICVVHFKRNIQKLKGKVSDEVFRAMWTLAGTETHADFEAACSIVRSGGKDAANWLKDKECFAFAALYQPYSKIPLHIWLAGNSNTNGVEQMHRDVNRDGKGLTLLGGIQRGLQHDVREAKQAALVRTEDIQRRYRVADPTNVQYLSIQRHAREEHRRVLQADNAMERLREQVQSADVQIPKLAELAARMLTAGNEPAAARAVKRLRIAETEAAHNITELSSLQAHGSGRVVVSSFTTPPSAVLQVPAHLEPTMVAAPKRRPRRTVPHAAVMTAPGLNGQISSSAARSTSTSSYLTTIPVPARTSGLELPLAFAPNQHPASFQERTQLPRIDQSLPLRPPTVLDFAAVAPGQTAHTLSSMNLHHAQGGSQHAPSSAAERVPSASADNQPLRWTPVHALYPSVYVSQPHPHLLPSPDARRTLVPSPASQQFIPAAQVVQGLNEQVPIAGGVPILRPVAEHDDVQASGSLGCATMDLVSLVDAVWDPADVDFWENM